jgi:hypothetical protein
MFLSLDGMFMNLYSQVPTFLGLTNLSRPLYGAKKTGEWRIYYAWRGDRERTSQRS